MRLTTEDIARLRAAMEMIARSTTDHDPTLLIAPRILADHATTWQALMEDDPDLYQLLADWHLAYIEARTQMANRRSTSRSVASVAARYGDANQRLTSQDAAILIYQALVERDHDDTPTERQQGRGDECEGG